MVERILRYIVVLIAIFYGCKGESGSSSSKKGVGASGYLTPGAPSSSTPIRCIFKAPKGSKLLWYVNGTEVAVDVNPIDTSYFQGGDTVSAAVELPDGRIKQLGRVVVGSSAPMLHSLLITPEKPHYGKDVGVKFEASDPDGDEVSLDIEWFINGKSVYRGEKLPGDMIKAGDVITCKARPFDGTYYGPWFSSMNSAVVQNTPPVVHSKPGRFEGKTFKMPLIYEDPDGDSVSIKILEAPKGSFIRNDTFYFEYKGDTAFSAPVKLEFKDKWGGVSRIGFNIKAEKNKIK